MTAAQSLQYGSFLKAVLYFIQAKVTTKSHYMHNYNI